MSPPGYKLIIAWSPEAARRLRQYLFKMILYYHIGSTVFDGTTHLKLLFN